MSAAAALCVAAVPWLGPVWPREARESHAWDSVPDDSENGAQT